MPRRRRAARAAVGAQEDALRRGHPPRRRPPARRRQGRLSLFAAALLAASAIAAASAPKAAPVLPADALLLPLARQETNYSCGAAALLSVLKYWNAFGGAEKELYGVLDTTPADGTDPRKLVEGARHFGLRARWAENLSLADLRRALARGETPIVDIQAWPDRAPKSWRDDWDDGHYAVLVGMDGSFAYFMDPSTDGSYAYMPLAELADRWHDFEDRGGKVRRYVHFAAFIRGRSAPAPSKAPNGALQPLS